jgi:3-hydroxyisobutyrate dehydrogenase
MADRIGFIGLGIMGRPMALNLHQAGFEVIAWNRTAAKVEVVVAEGLLRGDSPGHVAAQADITITMVRDSPDVEAVVLGPGGVIEGARAGSVVIDMSTISPEVTRAIAARLREQGVHMLDAPVSGGDVGAQQGTLSIMVGGEPDAFERCRPVFEAMGKTITHCGPNGTGQTVKLCNQIVCGLNILAMSEALCFAAKAGVDLRVMHQAISAGAAGSWMLTNLAPKVLDRDFAPGFTVDLQQKDLKLALDSAREIDAVLPGTGLVHQLFRALQAQGEGSDGTQALAKALERLSGTEIRG